ncbi:hypothetical protein GCM10027079_25740 [Sediminivirga luteola]|uniref:Uncharacterized protein n=1 Tax=Sediminivirga luteola TaxID=1774748 RepID=A0A8J2U0S0_9MICO|nr:hypothetical protein GCM10011333_30700 [Sediminivirga luteola]
MTVIADPGMPTRLVNRVKERVQDRLAARYRAPVRITVSTELLPLDEDAAFDTSVIDRYADDDASRLFVLLTEIPRYRDATILLAEAVPERGLAVVSVPALGAFGARRRLARVLLSCVEALADNGTADRAVAPDPGGTLPDWRRDHAHGTLVLRTPKLLRTPKILVGMVLANEPLRTVPRLSSALAAASATGAFGIFYNSIWQMAAHLSAFRLTAIGALAITAMAAWLMIRNGLWERTSSAHRRTATFHYNCSTALTLLMCMLLLYVLLFVLILFGALIVIDPGFMAEILGGTPGLMQYVEIAWLSAAMGVVAGALGSGFDDSTDVRRLTHGQRERLRFRDTADED